MFGCPLHPGNREENKILLFKDIILEVMSQLESIGDILGLQGMCCTILIDDIILITR